MPRRWKQYNNMLHYFVTIIAISKPHFRAIVRVCLKRPYRRKTEDVVQIKKKYTDMSRHILKARQLHKQKTNFSTGFFVVMLSRKYSNRIFIWITIYWLASDMLIQIGFYWISLYSEKPTSHYWCDISLKEAVFVAGTMTRRWARKLVTLFGVLQREWWKIWCSISCRGKWQ